MVEERDVLETEDEEHISFDPDNLYREKYGGNCKKRIQTMLLIHK